MTLGHVWHICVVSVVCTYEYDMFLVCVLHRGGAIFVCLAYAGCVRVAYSSMFKLSVHCVCSVWRVNHGGAVRVGACGMLQHVCGICAYGLCVGMA